MDTKHQLGTWHRSVLCCDSDRSAGIRPRGDVLRPLLKTPVGLHVGGHLPEPVFVNAPAHSRRDQYSIVLRAQQFWQIPCDP